MEELQERSELSEFYSKLQKQSQISDLNQKWENAAIWKWCDLDGHPHDNVVSRHELFPVRAPLVTLEHCIGDFLDKCDSNADHDISFNVSFKRCYLIGHKVIVSHFESTLTLMLDSNMIFSNFQEWTTCLEIENSELEARCENL